MTPKPGIKTTEFWTTLAALIASVLGLVLPDTVGTALPGAVQGVIAAVGGLVVAIYTGSRTALKKAAAAPAPPTVPRQNVP